MTGAGLIARPLLFSEVTLAASTLPVELADQARAEVADLLDLQLSPLGLVAIDAMALQSGETVLDIGCGAGQTLLQLAERVGPTGRVIGIDIAARVLDVARSRTAGIDQICLVQADAAVLALPDGTADCVYSRFGVMGLTEPIPAFANFRRMTKPGGRLGFVCWRSLEENELDFVPLQAAGLDLSVDRTPFKFERRDFITDILHVAGWRHIEILPFDAKVSSGGIDAMTTVLTRVGALGQILRGNPALYPRAEEAVRAVLRARMSGADVNLTAACWVVVATA